MDLPPDYTLDFDGYTHYLDKGFFRVESMFSGMHALEILSPGYTRKIIKDINVDCGDTIDLGEMRIFELAGEITGQIVSAIDGSPRKGIWVSAYQNKTRQIREFTTSDNNGCFKLEYLPPGTYSLSINDKGHKYQDIEIPNILLTADETKKIPLVEMKVLNISENSIDNDFILPIPSIGICLGKNEQLKSVFDLPTSICEICPGSVAESAGLNVGDVILKVNDKSILDSPEDFLKDLLDKPGEKVKLTVKRGARGKVEDLVLTIDEWDYHETLEYFEVK